MEALRSPTHKGGRRDSSSRANSYDPTLVREELLEEHFRGHVFGTAAEGVGGLAFVVEGLGKAEVRDLDVAVDGDEQVLGFQVPVDDVPSL